MKRIILKKGEEDRILRGHPWVYDNEVERIVEGKAPVSEEGGAFDMLEAGECADVESSHKTYLGRAIVNPNSKIIARIYSPSKEGMDKGFFKRRLREALQRRAVFRDLSRESARIVFAEADFLPGLIIDRFIGWPLSDIENVISGGPWTCRAGPFTFELAQAALGPPRSWIVLQFLAWGMDSRREMILEAADELLCAIEPALEGVIEKSAARARELEGLPLREELLRGVFPAGGIVIFENGLPFAVDLMEGQKTGHFLDQRDNHALAGKFAALLSANAVADAAPDAVAETAGDSPLRALDACAYTGGFGIHVLRAVPNATVTALDVSAAALETLRKNAALNGVTERITAVEGDIFDLLKAAERKKEKYDLVMLDPPAFAKSRTQLAEAIRGYKEINLRAIRLLRRGGLLVSCSCSQALDEGRFKRMIADAAADAERRLIQLDFRYQGQDHPILLGYDESLYLKCGFFRAL
jgi:23S rRNA (cytosine1962-C5)-methyltransferase